MDETSIKLRGDFSSPEAQRLQASLTRALELDSKLPADILAMTGMSGRLYRRFVNNLIEVTPGARYLEVGSWGGSTACSAMYGNKVHVTCIDDWSQFGGPKDGFLASMNRTRIDSPEAEYAFIENDFRKVDFASLKRANIYLFDGPHEHRDHYDGIAVALPAVTDRFVLLIDDWNWIDVRDGTMQALRDNQCKVVCNIDIRTNQFDQHPTGATMQDSPWHNGYAFFVIDKP